MTAEPRGAVVLGGAGFLGSHIVGRFCDAGWQVTIIDGLVAGTGGREAHLEACRGQIRFDSASVEDVADLPAVLNAADVVVDCMGWTSHLEAMQDPARDLRLNVASHLAVLAALGGNTATRVVYLGSRGQYGNPAVAEITEEVPMVPVDIQGAHKLVAETYYRLHGRRTGATVISLRIGNCFGARQPRGSGDIGLVGGFARSLLVDGVIEVFGQHRRRPFMYAPDLAELVLRVSDAPVEADFTAWNVAGLDLPIAELAATLVAVAGRGRIQYADAPAAIRQIEVGEARFSDARLQQALGPSPLTPLPQALAATLRYFEEGLR